MTLSIREKQIKTIMRCHLTLIRMATIKNQNQNKTKPTTNNNRR